MSYRIGDNGLDHNIPNLDRQMGKMSLNNPPPGSYQRPSLGYGAQAYLSANDRKWWGGSRKNKKSYVKKKHIKSKLSYKRKRKNNKKSKTKKY
jgi:hypothetical protein